MSHSKFGVVCSSILFLFLASATAWANDPIVFPARIALEQPAPITQENGTASGRLNTDSTRYEGARWSNSSVITWSIADSPGTADAPFSGYMGSQYEALVQKAFQPWAAASGLTFEEVADSSQSDIRLGWGIFNTSSTGVVGHTRYQAQSGQLQPGVIIRLEDPSQHALIVGKGNTLAYSGTDANLYQVTLHEIGHALGLADNNDPNSVMCYEATGTNNMLASSDVAGIQTLYGSPTLATQVLQAAASESSRGRTKQYETTPPVLGESLQRLFTSR